VLGGASGGGGWLEKWLEDARKSSRKFAQHRGGQHRANYEGR